MSARRLGRVSLVGAGPGDAELLTLKGKRCLEAADVILYDELVNRAVMQYAAANAELIYVGKKAAACCTDQRWLESLMIEKARAGRYVVRLKGGDPFIFGRGGEEAQALRRAGIPFDIVPGVSAATAAPAYAGIPVTHRAVASSFAVVTGHRASQGTGSVNWGRLAAAVDTLIIVMGLHNLGAIMERLLEGGCEPDRPVILIQDGTRESQKTLRGTVTTIAELAAGAGFTAPATIVVGNVVHIAEPLAWFKTDGLVSSPRPAEPKLDWLSAPKP
jgi:uroporphyrinogen III methyltransferase / synthase